MTSLMMDIAAFENYPWGRVVFQKLIRSVKQAEVAQNSYLIEGFVQVLQVWNYYVLPGVSIGGPIKPARSPFILRFQGSKGRKYFKNKLLSQTRVQQFVLKDYEEMFPLWDADGEDDRVVNIVNAVFEGGFTFSSDHWEAEGIKIDEALDVDEGVGKKRKLPLNVDEGVDKKRKASLAPEGEEDLNLENLENLKTHIDISLSKVVEGFTMMTKKIEGVEKTVAALCEKVEVVENSLEELKEKRRDAVSSRKTRSKAFIKK